jgi:hypothetical protein
MRNTLPLLGLVLVAACVENSLGEPTGTWEGDPLASDGGLSEPTAGGAYELSETHGPIRAIVANRETYLKATTGQSSTLSSSQKCALSTGSRLILARAATPSTAGHYSVSLMSDVPGCSIREGFVFGDHFDAVGTLTANAATWLKSSTADSSTLRPDQRCALGSGAVLTLRGEPTDAGRGHFAVTVDPPVGCSISRGYVFGAHFGLRVAPGTSPTPGARRLENLTYYYQYHNANEPSGTCGVTSAAMLLSSHGTSVTPDQLYRRFGRAQGQSPEGLASIYRAYGLYATSTYSGTFDQIKRHIDAGRPVVVHGDFTAAGHIVVAVGYDDRGFVFHDPSGRWSGIFRGGYPGRTSTNGRFVHYSTSSLQNVIGPSGNVWMSVASRSPL